MKLALPLLVLFPALATACINDRDTLGFELKGKPDVQRALTGRFDRYPRLYYQMRVDRLKAKSTLTPEELDDLAAAYDRMGQSKEAIRTIRRKLTLPNPTKEQQYRTDANLGTFLAHEWVHSGAKREDLTLLQEGERHIAKAIQRKPNAHFGREGTQLEIMRYLIHDRKGRPNGVDDSLGAWLVKRDSPKNAVSGLAGIVVLGAAWESPEVAAAMAYALEWKTPSLAEMARLRYQELLAAGRKPLTAGAATDVVFSRPLNAGIMVAVPTPKRFAMLRKEADERHQRLTDYTLQRLATGRHPDTDPAFWKEWHEPPMPSIPAKMPDYLPSVDVLVYGAGISIGLAIGVYGISRSRRKMRQAETFVRLGM
jgi:tetratricopeptide (TPR) repeat protein